MKLKQAINRADIIQCSIHVDEGQSYQLRIKKEDALVVLEDYLNKEPKFVDTWVNIDDYTIAIMWKDNDQTTLAIGR